MRQITALILFYALKMSWAFSPAAKSFMFRSSSKNRRTPPFELYLDFFNFNKVSDNNDSKEISNSKVTDDDKNPQEKKTKGYSDDDDPIEKIFNFFFGEKEESPMGMQRFGKERFPEQYPAVKDEWAELLPSDDKEMNMMRPFLKNTNLEKRALKLSYDANRDGWDAFTFHRKVDKLGGAVVLCETITGVICGGYNPKGWVGYGEARGSIAAFLFVLGGKYATSGAPGTKLQKVGGPGLAQLDNPETAVSFGADSLVIPLAEDNPKLARSKLGSYYERFPDGTNSLFGKDASVQLKSLKVYHGVYAKDEFIPFTDAEPFALY
mmetsp:Transcript_8125/g.15297  ORF Transcript_8125/g.15297 Transcript_8125/m.15297 type:complete len:322 (-) Transcript_8125:71-1036(-)